MRTGLLNFSVVIQVTYEDYALENSFRTSKLKDLLGLIQKQLNAGSTEIPSKNDDPLIYADANDHTWTK